MTATQGKVPEKRAAFEPAAGLLKPTSYNPDMPRPAATVVGAALVLFRTLAGVIVLAGIAAGWDGLLAAVDSAVELLSPGPEARRTGLVLVVVVGSVLMLFQGVLAVLIFKGYNWPRVLVMLVATFDISTTFFAWSARGQDISVQNALLSVALDILILLALSSRSAAAYARRNEQRL